MTLCPEIGRHHGMKFQGEVAKSSISESLKRAEHYRQLSQQYADHTAPASTDVAKFRRNQRRHAIDGVITPKSIICPHVYSTYDQRKLATKLMRQLGEYPSQAWLGALTPGEMGKFIKNLYIRLKRKQQFSDPLGITKKAQSDKQPGSSRLLPHAHPSDRPRIVSKPAVSGNAN